MVIEEESFMDQSLSVMMTSRVSGATGAPLASVKSLRKKKFVFVDPEGEEEDGTFEIDSSSSNSEESED